MKKLHLFGVVAALSVAAAFALPAPASADPLSAIQAFTLNDVKAAEAVYAANPSVPTAQAAGKCLGWMDATLSAPGAPLSIGNYAPPQGVASTVADLDVALNNANAGLPPIVLAFNDNCGGYVEDLKAEAAATAAKGFAPFGIKLPF